MNKEREQFALWAPHDGKSKIVDYKWQKFNLLIVAEKSESLVAHKNTIENSKVFKVLNESWTNIYKILEEVS